jgi:uncharacterized membrane protein YhaH (DUF805 family)
MLTEKSTYTSFEGRIGRQTWWLGQLLFGLLLMIPYFLAIGIVFLTMDTSGEQPVPSTPGMVIAGVIMLLVVVLSFWASLALGAKRWHDHGKSGWYLLWSLVPFVNLWAFIKLGFLRGTQGPNEYGPDPVAD